MVLNKEEERTDHALAQAEAVFDAVAGVKGSTHITRNAFLDWYMFKDRDSAAVDTEGGFGHDDSSSESGIKEEKAMAEEAFDDFAKGSNHIATTDFPKLLEALGSTYCEEEHRRTIKKISSVEDSSSDKVITRKAFLDWYIDWLFADGDSDEESDDKSAPFAASKKEESTVPATSSAFPPMSTAAHKNPFGKAATPSSSSSAFPPMSKAAPKSSLTSTSAPAPVASSSAFPPMSKAAPKSPFTSTSAPAPAASSSAQAPATAASAQGVPINLFHALASQATSQAKNDATFLQLTEALAMERDERIWLKNQVEELKNVVHEMKSKIELLTLTSQTQKKGVDW